MAIRTLQKPLEPVRRKHKCNRPPTHPPTGLTDRVGGGLLALLVEAVVSGDGAVRCLRLYGLAIRANKHAGHHAQGAVACNVKCLRQKWTLHNISGSNGILLKRRDLLCYCLCSS